MANKKITPPVINFSTDSATVSFTPVGNRTLVVVNFPIEGVKPQKFWLDEVLNGGQTSKWQSVLADFVAAAVAALNATD
jgi:hypothetical protein